MGFSLLQKVFNHFCSDNTTINKRIKRYATNFKMYAFTDCCCVDKVQIESSIIRLYHTVEKGLAYSDYRPGFGKENIEKLVYSLTKYGSIIGIDSFVYCTALSCLNEYINKNSQFGYYDKELEERIHNLPGNPNGLGGTISVKSPDNIDSLDFEDFFHLRHSIRHFSAASIDDCQIQRAIELAQHTPSACNRQGWRTIVISDKETIKFVLENQNGNRGFGHEFDKLLVVISDIRAQQKNRELFQAYIDGGMYAANILNALFYYKIGSCPLSASLTIEQENKIRKLLKIHDAEVFILFVGIGNYPEDSFLTTRSERKKPYIEYI